MFIFWWHKFGKSLFSVLILPYLGLCPVEDGTLSEATCRVPVLPHEIELLMSVFFNRRCLEPTLHNFALRYGKVPSGEVGHSTLHSRVLVSGPMPAVSILVVAGLLAARLELRWAVCSSSGSFRSRVSRLSRSVVVMR